MIIDSASFSTCAYPLSAVLGVLEANAIGSSLPSGSVREITAPMPYGGAVVASRFGWIEMHEPCLLYEHLLQLLECASTL